MLRQENLAIKQVAENWEAAVRRAGALLEAAGSITPEYTEAMVAAVHEFGPYMVILPHFALAHAAPSSAVLKDDISLITLQDPVTFDSPNDPVYVVMALCSKDGQSHIETLSSIAEKLMAEDAVSRLIEAQSVEDIIAVLA